MYPIRSRARADLPKLPQTVVALVPKVGSVGKRSDAVAAKPFCARSAAITGRQESLAAAPKALTIKIVPTSVDLRKKMHPHPGVHMSREPTTDGNLQNFVHA